MMTDSTTVRAALWRAPHGSVVAGIFAGAASSVALGGVLQSVAAAALWVQLPFVLAFMVGAGAVMVQGERPWRVLSWGMRLVLFSLAAIGTTVAFVTAGELVG